MNTENKTKQIVVNVSETSKATINSLKEKFQVSDKEFIEAALVVLGNTADDVFQTIVDGVVVEKQKAKIQAKIDKQREVLAKLQASIV